MKKSNGLEAKNSLIRSGRLIQKIHQVVKQSVYDELITDNNFKIHPPLNMTSPEKTLYGFLKQKKQDIVVLFDEEEPEIITSGLLEGNTDNIGSKATSNSIIIGVRSQLSSINKNFDTMMERAISEPLNMRLKYPSIIMGEVYMVAVREFDEQSMKDNQVAFKNKTNVEQFIKTFNEITSANRDITEQYKYDVSALILVDFSRTPVKVYNNLDELKEDEIVSDSFGSEQGEDYTNLSPEHFANRLSSLLQ